MSFYDRSIYNMLIDVTFPRIYNIVDRELYCTYIYDIFII